MMAGLAFAFLASGPACAANVIASKSAPVPYPDLAPLTSYSMVQHVLLPELPEPEVVAMMVLGLMLIGYRASRDSNDTFK